MFWRSTGPRRPASRLPPTIPLPASSRSLAPRRWPLIRRHCSRSGSTTPAPILRPKRASSTWSSTMGRPQAICACDHRGHPSQQQCTHPRSRRRQFDGPRNELPHDVHRKRAAGRDRRHRYADHRCRQHDSRFGDHHADEPAGWRPAGGFRRAAGRHHGFQLQSGTGTLTLSNGPPRSPTTRLRWRRSASARLATIRLRETASLKSSSMTE